MPESIRTVALNSRLASSLSQRKIPSLDGLRAVAVFLVIANHLHVPYAPDGRGVLTFFVLSGFLITWMLLSESEKYGEVSVRNFYVRRVLRIFPAFYVYLILSVLTRCFALGWPTRSLIFDYLSSFFYINNYRFAMTPYMEHTGWHTWALSIEEQFYLLWPCVFVAFRKDLRQLTRILIGIVLFVDLYRILLFFGFHVHRSWLAYSFDCRADHLLIGCLLAVLVKRGVLNRVWNFLTAHAWLSLVSLGLMIASIAADFHFHWGYRFSIGFVVDPLLTAILLLQVIAMAHTRLWGWLNWSVIRFIGQVSYGTFLYQMFANRLFVGIFGQRSLWLHVPGVALLAVLFGTCSFYLVETRFLRLKSKFLAPGSKMPVPVLVRSYELAGD